MCEIISHAAFMQRREHKRNQQLIQAIQSGCGMSSLTSMFNCSPDEVKAMVQELRAVGKL